jgi:hypothetical protein
LSGVNYQFDDLNRRFEADLADGTKWSCGYNNRNEVTSGKRKLASGMDRDAAKNVVTAAIRALRDAGVAGPARIPWGG